ncbi:MAG: aldose 1-epimerase [Planctomycetota bacterium]
MTGKITEDMFRSEKIISKKGGHKVEAEIFTDLGANLGSFKVNGRELIYFPKDKLIKEDYHSGCFMMFPTPCRLTDSRYTFGGKKILQKKHGQDVSIHGLIRDETMTTSRQGDSLVCSIDIAPGHPVYEGYPFKCRFSLKFTALERGLEIAFKYENTGYEAAPFGFGLHPFWGIPGQRKDVFVRVPCRYVMELVDLIPTGELTEVEGTSYDIRDFKSLAEVSIDNVFWGRDMSVDQAIEFRDIALRLTLESSEEFGFMIAYTPAGEPFACVEQLTCAPDAPNLYAKDKAEISGLRVVSAGEVVEGWVRYKVSDL